MTKKVAIVQARMGSTRLPGKMTKELAGKTVLVHVLERLKSVKKLDYIIVATTERPEDDKIEEIAKSCGVAIFRGSTDDVLSRYYEAAKQAQADVIVRVTGDCPLIDPDVLNETLEEFELLKPDYMSNVIEFSYPHGMDFEIFTFKTLETANQKTTNIFDREHVTYYVTDNYDKFNVRNKKLPSGNFHHLRIVLDEQADLDLLTILFDKLGENARLKDVIKLSLEEPELFKMNTKAAENYEVHAARR